MRKIVLTLFLLLAGCSFGTTPEQPWDAPYGGDPDVEGAPAGPPGDPGQCT